MIDSIEISTIMTLSGGDAFVARDLDYKPKELTGGDAFLPRTKDLEDELIEAPSRPIYCGDIYPCALKDYQKRLRLKQEELREGELDRDTHLEYGANVYSSVLKDEQSKKVGSVEPQLRQPTEGRTGESKLRLGEVERDALLAYRPNWL